MARNQARRLNCGRTKPVAEVRRGLLLATAASAAVFLAAPGPAVAACVTTLSTLNCDSTGTITTPIIPGASITTLNINTVSGGINIASGDAVQFSSSGQVTINSNPVGLVPATDYSIIASNGRGIYAYSEDGALKIDSTGNIKATGDAIRARRYNMVSNILEITSTGNLSSSAGRGISGNNPNSEVSISNTGDVTASGYGIEAVLVSMSLAKIVSTGDVKSTGSAAIRGYSGSGDVYIKTVGAVQGQTKGIQARSSGGGEIDIRLTGSVTATTGAAVYVDHYGVSGQGGTISITGGATILANSTINAAAHGILVNKGGKFTGSGAAIDIDVTGNITSAGASGIYARACNNSVSVTSGGTIDAKSAGIDARSCNGSGAVNVETTGTSDVTSSVARGIFASADLGSVTVTADGEITAATQGIYAVNSGAAAIDVTGGATVNSTGTGMQARTITGAVTFSVTGAITSTTARGIDAQATGSGAGSMSVTTSGAVASRNEGIFAYSKSGSVSVNASAGSVVSAAESAIVTAGTGNLSVSAGGAVTGASGFAGVKFGDGTRNGASNTLTVSAKGSVSNAGGLNQLAVLGLSGDEAVTNFGMVTGNVDLGGGSDSFLNKKNGTFVTGATVTLGSGASETLTNEGNLKVGGEDNILTTSLTGNFTQTKDATTADGTFFVDFKPDSVAASRVSDVLVLSGSAALSGVVKARQWSSTVVNAAQQFVIMETSGGTITTSGLTLQLEGDLNYAGYAASLSVLGTNQLVLKFTPLGRYWDGGDSTSTPVNDQIDGGDGVWNSANNNWTVSDGKSNNAWPQNGTAIFAGELGGGTVEVVGPQKFGGLSFEKSGIRGQYAGRSVLHDGDRS